jgi:tetratricopeptide (TPR) repeat protein
VARHPEPLDVVEEIETGAERLAAWIAHHPWLAGGTALAVLGVAGAFGTYTSWKSTREQAASDALETVRVEYLKEMGASPTALEVPELANPKAAAEIQERTLARYREVALAERGTAAGTLALLEAADLLEALGRRDEIAPLYAEALENAPSPVLRALVQRRLGHLHEQAGRFAEAAAAFEAAAAIEAYPLRHFALADAARCAERAGHRAEALALYERLDAEAPELPLPDHLAAQARELRAARPPEPSPGESTAAPSTAALPEPAGSTPEAATP